MRPCLTPSFLKLQSFTHDLIFLAREFCPKETHQLRHYCIKKTQCRAVEIPRILGAESLRWQGVNLFLHHRVLEACAKFRWVIEYHYHSAQQHCGVEQRCPRSHFPIVFTVLIVRGFLTEWLHPPCAPTSLKLVKSILSPPSLRSFFLERKRGQRFALVINESLPHPSRLLTFSSEPQAIVYRVCSQVWPTRGRRVWRGKPRKAFSIRWGKCSANANYRV